MANRADYAWAPGDNVSEWKLDISTRDNAIRAAMALGPKGYRGNRVEIPEADLPAVKRKVAAALRKFGVPADSVVWQHVKASEDEATGDPADTVATPPPAFLSKLYERLKALWKGDQPITHEAFADAVKHARAHAGGKAKAQNARAALRAARERAYNATTLEDLRQAFNDLGLDASDSKIDTVLSDVGWHRVEFVDWLLGNHWSKQRMAGEEPLTLPFTSAKQWHLLQQARESDSPVNLVDLCAQDEGGSETETVRLFTELQSYADLPEWVNVLPTPGRWQHDKYGVIETSAQRAQRMHQNFVNGVYQRHIPIDIEHQTKLSGATGYYRELRVNDDGSLDGSIDWTDRGKSLVGADRFKYFSPEFYDEWTDPATGITYQDVLIGGAITTRPFFKEKSLRPLVASERGLEFADDAPNLDAGEPIVIFHALQPVLTPAIPDHKEPPVTDNSINAPPQPQPVGMTEDQAKQFAELQQQATALKQLAEQQATQLKQATEQVAALHQQRRRKAFTELVTGRGEAGDGASWFGDPQAHVSLLEKMADAFGEDSDELKQYVEQQRGAAAQLHDSHLFGTFSAAGRSPTTAEQRIAAEAEKLRATDPNLTVEQAKARVIQQQPRLYTESLAEKGQR